MALILLILQPAYASSLGQSTGKSLGYSYIAISCLILFILGLMNLKRPQHKGLPLSIFQFVLLTQFCRYTALFSFGTSDFYVAVWYYFNKVQYPSALLSCSAGAMPWIALGFNSTNFICNSLIEFIEIGALALFWAAIQLGFPNSRGKRNKDFLVLIVYCSATDLCVTAFIQIDNV